MTLGKSSFISLAALICIIAGLVDLANGQSVSCKDEKGNPVDWYIAYKFPKLGSYAKTNFASGYAYAYFTNKDIKNQDEPLTSKVTDQEDKIFIYKLKQLFLNYLVYPLRAIKRRITRSFIRIQPKSRWNLSNKLASDRRSVIMRTLEIAYDKVKGKDLNVIFYNDDPPEHNDYGKKGMSNSYRAHAKGAVLIDEKTGNGVWLTHSVPQFPPHIDQELAFNESSARNGQTFMCITFDINESGGKIIDHLINMRPIVYERKISNYLEMKFPQLSDLEHEFDMKNKRVSIVPKLSQLITTKEGQILHLYSKSANFGQDLYDGWIDKDINSALFVETWRRGSGNPLNSSCPDNDYQVNNIKDLKYNDDVGWSFSIDHSKWAISEDANVGFVCISDINRMESQFKRGGGAVCFKCSTCWQVFSNTIKDIEPCPIRRTLGKRAEGKQSLNLLKELTKIFSKLLHLY